MNVLRNIVPPSLSGTILALVINGFVQPVIAQDKLPVLNLGDFASVAIPSEFSFTDNLTWGFKTLLNHEDIKEIVPVTAYKYSDICPVLNEVSDVSRSVVFQIKRTENSPETAAFWNYSRAICSKSLMSENLEDLQIMPDATKSGEGEHVSYKLVSPNGFDMTSLANNFQVVEFKNAEAKEGTWQHVAKEVADKLLDNGDTTNFVLTVGEAPGNSEPVDKFWLLCNDRDSPSQNSVCQTILAHSPYKRHRLLANKSIIKSQIPISDTSY